MQSIRRMAFSGMLLVVPTTSLACEFDGPGGHRFFAFSSAHIRAPEQTPAAYDQALDAPAPSSQSAPETQQDAQATQTEQAPAPAADTEDESPTRTASWDEDRPTR